MSHFTTTPATPGTDTFHSRFNATPEAVELSVEVFGEGNTSLVMLSSFEGKSPSPATARLVSFLADCHGNTTDKAIKAEIVKAIQALLRPTLPAETATI